MTTTTQEFETTAEPGPASGKVESLVSQFSRYLLVGGTAFIVDFGVLALLTKALGWHHLVSASVAFLCGLIINYILCITWVFSEHAFHSRLVEFGITILVGLVGLGLVMLIMYLGTDMIGLDPLVSKLFAVGVVLFWNFGARKYFVFRGAGK